MVNFLGSFHVTPHVVVKGYPESDCLAARNDLTNGRAPRLPFGLAPRDPVGIGTAPRRRVSHRSDLVGKDQQSGAGFTDQFGRAADESESGLMRSFVFSLNVH